MFEHRTCVFMWTDTLMLAASEQFWEKCPVRLSKTTRSSNNEDDNFLSPLRLSSLHILMYELVELFTRHGIDVPKRLFKNGKIKLDEK